MKHLKHAQSRLEPQSLSKHSTVCGLILLGLMACSGGSKSQNAVSQEDSIVVDLPLNPPNSNELKNDEQIQLYKKIYEQEAIPVGEFIDQIIREHSNSAMNSDTLSDKISSIVKDANTQDPNQLKEALERALESDLGKSIVYNSNATSLRNIFSEGRLQCYSGTILNIVSYKMSLNGKTDPTRFPVVLFESGHVLPGFIVTLPQGNRLYGVETTAAGRALVDYGLTNELHQKISKPLRVISMNDFIVIEALKSTLSFTPEQKESLIKHSTAKLSAYGIDIEKLEEKIANSANANLVVEANQNLAKKKSALSSANLHSKFPFDNDNRKLNESPYAFGTSSENGQDKSRAKFDLTTPTDSSVSALDYATVIASQSQSTSSHPPIFYESDGRNKKQILSTSTKDRSFQIIESHDRFISIYEGPDESGSPLSITLEFPKSESNIKAVNILKKLIEEHDLKIYAQEFEYYLFYNYKGTDVASTRIFDFMGITRISYNEDSIFSANPEQMQKLEPSKSVERQD